MGRFSIFIVGILLVAGCNNNEESSAYSAILEQPPYRELTDSIKKEPWRDDLYFRRAVLLNKNNFPEPALDDFTRAWSLNNQESYALGASNSLMEKHPVQAIALLQDAVKKLPESILLSLQLARAYAADNRTDEAIGVCNDILRQQPDQVNTMVLLSELLEKKDDNTAALALLEKAYSLVPFNSELSYKLAYQYAETKNPKALALADTLIARDSLHLHAEPYYVKGVYYSNTNDKTNALRWLNETIKQNYNYLNAYIEKGKILLEQKKPDEAFKTFGLANTISPAFPDAWYWMGKAQEALGLMEEAKLNYEKAYGLDQTFTDAKEAGERIK